MTLLSNLYPGIKGTQGVQGIQGTSGPQGTQGTQGIQGLSHPGMNVTNVTSPYTLQTSDVGNLISINSGVSPVSISSETFSFGNSFMIYNGTSTKQTIAAGVGVSFYSGDGTINVYEKKYLNENDLTTILCSSNNDEFIFSTPLEGSSAPLVPLPIITTGLILYLDAGDSSSYPGSGTTWTDLSGSGNNATLVGSPSYTASPGYFDITSDITHAYLSSYSHGTNDFTYSMWVRFDAFDSYDTLFENGSWTDALLFRVQSTTSIAVYIEGALRGTFTWSPSINTWYNVVYTRSGSTNTLYVNATQSGSTFTDQTNISLANATMFLMRSQHTTNQFTNGQIAHFSIYNRALTSTEVQQNFDELKGRYGL